MGTLEDVVERDRLTQAALQRLRDAQLEDATNPTIENAQRLRSAHAIASVAVAEERAFLRQVHDRLGSLGREIIVVIEGRRRRTSVCPSCHEEFLATGVNPGGICDRCIHRPATWAAPPRAGPEFYGRAP
jgi:cyclopropane fatty-acyl-phospholipid synthase-like methyltransferase